MSRLYGRLRDALGETAGRVPRLGRGVGQATLLPRLEPEGDLARLLRPALLRADARTRDLDRGTGNRVVQRIGNRDRDLRPPLAHRRAVDRDLEPLGDVDPLRLREV